MMGGVVYITSIYKMIAQEAKKLLQGIFILVMLLTLVLFIIKPNISIINYGKSFAIYNSDINFLSIEISGRMKLHDKRGEKNFVLLANHPREYTFDNRLDPYSDMIKASGGASFISFIMGSDGSSVIERRYQSPQPQSLQHQCGPNPYGNPGNVRYNEKSNILLYEIKSFAELIWFSARKFKLYAVTSYAIGNKEVRVDFPIKVLNINPSSIKRSEGVNEPDRDEIWQAVSSRVPVYVEGNSECESIRAGYIAIRDFKGEVEINYLCRGANGVNDFTCVSSNFAQTRIFASYF